MTKTSSFKLEHPLVSSRVRVAVRLRPRNAEELAADADFGDCVKLQPKDILADITPGTDSILVSYLQCLWDVVTMYTGATVVEVRDQKSFVDLLRVGEAHRVAANTKLNTESSRSHAILMVNVRRSVKGRPKMDVSISGENWHSSSMMGSLRPPIVRKSKLVVVDLAGSERIDKSGLKYRMDMA